MEEFPNFDIKRICGSIDLTVCLKTYPFLNIFQDQGEIFYSEKFFWAQFDYTGFKITGTGITQISVTL
jgi:hypothetical protein